MRNKMNKIKKWNKIAIKQTIQDRKKIINSQIEDVYIL